jgi:acyl-CoA dehydrogenase
MLVLAGPNKEQQRDIDFLLAMGEIFSLIAYCHLILENASIYQIEPELVNQIFDVMVRDFSAYALELYSKTNTSSRQMKSCQKMIQKPVPDPEGYTRVWEAHVLPLNGAYEMNE